MSQASDFVVYKEVGARLRALRTSRRLTQAQVADIIGVSPQQYQKYEDAQTKCSLAAVIALAGFYGVSVESIVSSEPQSITATTERLSGSEIIPGDLSKLGAIEQELVGRLVSAYLRIPDKLEKVRLVELIEAIKSAHL